MKNWTAVVARAWKDFSAFFGAEKVKTALLAAAVLFAHLGIKALSDGWVPVREAWDDLWLPTGIVLTALFGYFLHKAPQRVAADEAERLRIEKDFQEQAAASEAWRRQEILRNLRFRASHEGISHTGPLPREWVEERLAQMGETWRQDEY